MGTDLPISSYDLVLKSWNRSLNGITEDKDFSDVRKICYEMLEKDHCMKHINIRVFGVLARLGDLKESYELFKKCGETNFSGHLLISARNILLSALSDYESYKEMFWDILESEFFHCEVIGAVPISSTKKYWKVGEPYTKIFLKYSFTTN